MDNGSLEPASVLQSREIARALERRLDVRVRPVSLAHSAKISADALGGRAAELFEAALDDELQKGTNEIFVVPLFVGPSHAIVRHVPAVVAGRQKAFPSACISIASPLYVPGDLRMASILADHIQEQLEQLTDQRGDGIDSLRVAIVDHGSPSRLVTEVRDCLTAQVRALLGDSALEVAACSMERRPDPEFNFNDPLLEKLLVQPGWNTDTVIVGMLFIGPGKHAGSRGDIADICTRARGEAAPVKITKLLGQHPLLVEILEDRARHAFALC
jgi:sirohydrochlorin ferrochelatase